MNEISYLHTRMFILRIFDTPLQYYYDDLHHATLFVYTFRKGRERSHPVYIDTQKIKTFKLAAKLQQERK